MLKTNRIILSVILILLLTGCTEIRNYEIDNVNSSEYDIFIDDTTCVEYLTERFAKKGGISVRYNRDGTIKINESCLKNKLEK